MFSHEYMTVFVNLYIIRLIHLSGNNKKSRILLSFLNKKARTSDLNIKKVENFSLFSKKSMYIFTQYKKLENSYL